MVRASHWKSEDFSSIPVWGLEILSLHKKVEYNPEMIDPEMTNFGRHLRKYTVRLLRDYKVEFIERFLEK